MHCTVCGSPYNAQAHYCTSCGSAIPSINEDSGQKAEALAKEIQYADFWIRFIAYIIDSFVVYLPVAFIFGLYPSATSIPVYYFNNLNAQDLVVLITGWLYYATMESSPKQATLGKIILKIHVTDLKGERITFLRATNRFLGKIASAAILMIGFIMAGFTKKKQALHDLIAGTLVVNKTAE